MATKARSPKSPAAQCTAAAALAASQPQANSYSIVPHAVVPVSPSPAATAGAPLFALTAKQPRGCNTKQGAKSGAGKNWHAAPTAFVAPNTRANAYAALQALGSTFTQATALAALAPVVAGTSGTPRSYWAAFVAGGYIAPVVA